MILDLYLEILTSGFLFFMIRFLLTDSFLMPSFPDFLFFVASLPITISGSMSRFFNLFETANTCMLIVIYILCMYYVGEKTFFDACEHLLRSMLKFFI